MFDGAGADVIRDVNGLTVSYTADEIRNYLYLIVYKNYTIQMESGKNKEQYNAVNVAARFDEFVKNRVLQ